MKLQPLKIIQSQAERFWSLSIRNHHRESTVIAASSSDHHISLFWLSKEESRAVINTKLLENAHKKAIRCVSFSPDGSLLAACSFDGTISVWDVNLWKCVASLEGHENEVKCVAWSHDSQFLASCGRDRTVWIWSINILTPSGSLTSQLEREFECQAVLQEHSQDVKSVAWHPSETMLASAGYDETIKVIKGEECGSDDLEWTTQYSMDELGGTIWNLQINQAGYIFACTDFGEILVIKNNQIITRSKIHHGPIYGLDISENGMIATGGEDRSICIVRYENGSILSLLNHQFAHQSDINCIKWLGENELITASDDSTIKIWKLEKSQ